MLGLKTCAEKAFLKSLLLLPEPSHPHSLSWWFGPSCLWLEPELKKMCIVWGKKKKDSSHKSDQGFESSKVAKGSLKNAAEGIDF